MLILSPLSLVAFRILLLPYPRFSSLSRYSHGSLISSPYSQVSLCGHVQYTYTSTSIPTRPISLFLCVSVRCFPSPLNIFPFPSRFCVMSLAVGFPRAATSSCCQILSSSCNIHVRAITFPSVRQLSFLKANLSCFLSSVQSQSLRDSAAAGERGFLIFSHSLCCFPFLRVY